MVGKSSEREAAERISLRIDIWADNFARGDSSVRCGFSGFRNDKIGQ